MDNGNARVLVMERGGVVDTNKELCELDDLQLSLVGGGVGETVLS